MPREKFLHIDTTDKIMGIPVRHFLSGAAGAIGTSFFATSFFTSPLALLAIPMAGYLVYRISLQVERLFPGTSLNYYRKWLSGAQLYWPGPDTVSVPLVIPDAESPKDLAEETADASLWPSA